MRPTQRRILATWILITGVIAATPLSASSKVEPASASASKFRLPTNGSPAVDKALLLAIDERAFPLRKGLALYLTKPAVRTKPVLLPSTSPDAPDNRGAFFYGTVLHEGGRFRMWYYAAHNVGTEGGIAVSPLCYAESTDGENWTRPNLGQIEWHGSRHNNIVNLGNKPEGFIAGSGVIREDDDPRPGWRYKMVYYYIGERPRHEKSAPRRLGCAISPDGIHWTTLPKSATGDRFAEMASLYRHGGLYFLAAHIEGRGADDRPEGRQGYAWVSADFEHWLPEVAPSFRTPEPLVGSGYGTHTEAGKNIGLYTQNHLGVGAASFGNVLVGVYGMWNQRQPNWGEGGTSCDLGLVVSQDGFHFDEVVKGVPYIRSDESPADLVVGKNYPTILCQGNGILNVGDETLIYHGRWRNTEFQQLGTSANNGVNISRNWWGAVALARLPRDRWGALALSAKENSGSVWTAPVTLAADCRLTINGAGLDGLRVEIADARFQPLPGFEQGRASGANNDALDAEATWSGRQLRELAGKTVRFRIHFTRSETTNPRVFALNLLRKP